MKGKGSFSEYSTYENDEILGMFSKEALRLYGPAIMSFPRLVVKDFKLGKYNIKKGTQYFMPYIHTHHSEDSYAKWKTFDFDRFAKEKKQLKKNDATSYQPFGLGKRSCIGKYLGELMVKMMVVNILEKFEFRPLEGFEINGFFGLTYGVESCYLKIKPRI